MLRQLLRGKIHRATITQCDPDYVGSITIDAELLRATDIRPNEAVHVLDIDNGMRFETYVIRGEAGSGIIGINGAAARLVAPGHKVIIVCYGLLNEREIDEHEARVVLVGEGNRITQQLRYSSLIDELEPTT
ncbi:MAG: aspartate 1-decarboxylase [Phycisphaeraceae bacterium]|nr:aspartate 1-decarboxylase [Phycisphaeraceae bacterium]